MTGNDPWGFALPAEEPEPDVATVAGLIEMVDAQQNLIISVGTGGERIQDADAKYQRRRGVLNAALRARGIDPPFPWDGLWDWYGYYSAELGTYAERRIDVRRRAKVVRDALEVQAAGGEVADPGSSVLPAWAALDARLGGVIEELSRAQTRDDFQDVGRRCREVLIDASRLLADPALVPAGEEAPKGADAKAWLDLFLAARAAGRSHRELRAFVPVAWDLAQKVTHGDVDRVDAYAAVQATVLIVRTLQQLAGE